MAIVRRFALLLSSLLPVLAFPVQDGAALPNKYIVSLKDDAIDIESHLDWVTNVHARSLSRRDTIGVERTFNIGAFNAYAGEFDEETIAQIKSNRNVASVEQDTLQIVTSLVTQTDAPWGIASLSSPELPNGNTLNQTYVYDESAGEGTYAYVLDTGIYTPNSQFEGRAIKGYNAWEKEGEHFEDDFGHGSHVAGIIGSKTFGVAKKATVVDVKVCRSFGYSTIPHVLDGLDWTVKNITNTPGRAAKSVINVSLAFPTSDTLNAAFEAASAAGVLSVVGAGNDGKDASTRSPASAPSAITVGAVDWQKTAATWSNFGSSVDIFAPGVDIPSLWNGEGIVSTNSGTSMATPHVAGLVAYLRGKEDLKTNGEVIGKVLELAKKGVVKNAGTGTPNVLAYSSTL